MYVCVMDGPSTRAHNRRDLLGWNVSPHFINEFSRFRFVLFIEKCHRHILPFQIAALSRLKEIVCGNSSIIIGSLFFIDKRNIVN